MRLLALDPGTTQTAWVEYDPQTAVILGHGYEPNPAVRDLCGSGYHDDLAIETVASYGMPVGREVFETVEWCGRFIEAWDCDETVHRVYRREVKLHLCGSPRAKDNNIVHALYDRFGGSRAAAVGVKAAKGPLYGFKAHAFQALAVALTAAETRLEVVA